MAANKFATMIHRNTHKMNVILIYAVLEWILIFLLLLNSLLSYLISKFAEYFGLKPPCQFCSRFDHLLDPKNTTKDSYLDLVCEEHANEFSRLSHRLNRHEIQDSELICTNFSNVDLEISPKIDFFTWVGENGSENDEGNNGFCSFVLFRPCFDVLDCTRKMNSIEEIVEEEEEEEEKVDVESFSFGPRMEEDCSISLKNFKCDDDESFEIVTNSCWIDYCDIDRLLPVDLIDFSTFNSQRSCSLQACSEETKEKDGYKLLDEKMEFEVHVPTKVCDDEIKDQDQVEGKVRDSLEVEDEEIIITTRVDESIVDKEQDRKQLEIDGEDGTLIIERLKSALRDEKRALDESMAMITRLQEEKAEVELEASQYQKMMEEQAEYDQEALQLLNELMLKRDKEKHELENELDFYRKKSRSSRSKNSSGSSSNVEDLEGIFSDGSPFFNDGLDSEHTVHDSAKHLSALDESLVEFEEERMSILEELKVLEEKLFILADNEDRPFENFDLDYNDDIEKDYTFTTVEETAVSNGFSREPNSKMDYSAAKKLLPLFDDEEEEKSCFEKRNMLIDEDVDHVYERLMDLEAEKEFLKHSISSLKKGDKGMNVLEEILKNLRDLKSVELRMRSISDESNACSSI